MDASIKGNCNNRVKIFSLDFGGPSVNFNYFETIYGISVPDILDNMADILVKNGATIVMLGFSKGG